MENLTNLMHGFGDVLTPMILLLALWGVTIGTAVGVLPGIGPAMTVALLLPITSGLDPTPALIMFAGIFYGGMYGGSTTSMPSASCGMPIVSRCWPVTLSIPTRPITRPSSSEAKPRTREEPSTALAPAKASSMIAR